MITRVQPFTLNQKPKKINFGNAESLLAEFMQNGKTQDLVREFAQEMTATRLINNGRGKIHARMLSIEGGTPYMESMRESDARLSEVLLADVEQRILKNPLLDESARLQKLRKLFTMYCVPRLTN